MVKLFFQLVTIYLILHIANFDIEKINDRNIEELLIDKENVEEFRPNIKLNNSVVDIEDVDNDNINNINDNIQADTNNKDDANDNKNNSCNLTSRGTTKLITKKNTSMKTYMDYRAITNKTSAQYKLQQNSGVYTDSEGFRKMNDNFMIAIGNYFETKVGQLVEVELSSGGKFKAVVADIKNNIHTDEENLQHVKDGSVLEFVIDKAKLNPIIRKMGDCSYSKENNFKDNVISIKILDI